MMNLICEKLAQKRALADENVDLNKSRWARYRLAKRIAHTMNELRRLHPMAFYGEPPGEYYVPSLPLETVRLVAMIVGMIAALGEAAVVVTSIFSAASLNTALFFACFVTAGASLMIAGVANALYGEAGEGEKILVGYSVKELIVWTRFQQKKMYLCDRRLRDKRRRARRLRQAKRRKSQAFDDYKF